MDLTKMNKAFEICKCGKEHRCSTKNIEIGHGAISKVNELTEPYKHILLVSDDNTFKVCGEKVNSLIKEKVYKSLLLKPVDKLVVPDENSINAIEAAMDDKTDLIIGVGSGVINDLCKYVSFMHDLPYFIVATAPSMDGYASVGAALILKGMKVTANSHTPEVIIADTSILKDAPFEMLQAGYGDIIGKFSCLNDWKLSAVVNDEYFCQKVHDETLYLAKKTVSLSEGIVSRDEETIGFLMEALVKVGVLMSYVNSSRPASGSEHHFSHFFEITGLLSKTDYFAHGIDVVFSSFYTQKIREELLKIEKPLKKENIKEEEYKEKIEAIYGNLADEVIALQDKIGWYKEDRFERYISNWSRIKEILGEAPSCSEMEKYITQIGLDIHDFEDMYGAEKIQDAVWFAKDLKDRYSVLWLNFDLMYGGHGE